MYLWIKAFHVIAVIAWMAGMLYLPRLFVYHCDAEKGSSSPRPSRSWNGGC
jgi:putative membrane protein